MILDFRELEDGAVIEADLCIIGAGAAGIAMAREFVGTGHQVCLLESGGFEIDADTQSLYQGENIGQPYYDLETCRLRFFGGTTNHWAGWCGPLNPIDFEERDWVPYSGWPIGHADLEPYYPRAQDICGIGPFLYDDSLWEKLGMEAPAVDPEKIVTRFWQLSEEFRFGNVYRQELEAAENLRLLLNANVVNIQSNAEASMIEQLDLRSLDGRTGTAKARHYVLACGGIENARLLLLSNKVEPAGLGNQRDLVGRFFMEHLVVNCGTVAAADPLQFLTQYLKHSYEGVRVWGGLCTSEAMQRREKVLNGGIWTGYEPDPKSGVALAQDVWRSVKAGEWPDDLGSSIVTIMGDLDDVAVQTYRRVVEGREPVYPPLEIYLGIEAEQAPNPDSRITLGDETDLLGLRRPVLDWRLSEIDKRSIRLSVMAAGSELGRLNIARLRIPEWLLADDTSWDPDIEMGYHHIGTTRMSDDPTRGVVDANCALHGVDNFFIAGSSVFPTEGYINPTLSIVALALRLSDHLKTRLA